MYQSTPQTVSVYMKSNTISNNTFIETHSFDALRERVLPYSENERPMPRIKQFIVSSDLIHTLLAVVNRKMD